MLTDLLTSFSDFLSEHSDATAGLSLESKMVLFSRANLTVEEAVGFGENVIYLLALMFGDFWFANEELGLEEALGAFIQEMSLSNDMTTKFCSDLIEAVTDDEEDEDEEEDIDDVEEGSQEELEARVRIFLDQLLKSVPQSMGSAGYIDLKQKLAPPLYGNDYLAGHPGTFDRHKFKFGHTLADQEADRRDPALRRSVYSSSAVTALPEGEELDEHWHHHSDHGDYEIHQGAGVHGGLWAAREKGRGSHRDLHTFSGKNAYAAAVEHAEISTHAKHNGVVSEDVDMLLSQPAGDAGDKSGFFDASLATHSHYGDKVPGDTAKKNAEALKGGGTKPFRHGVMVPHHAVAETEAEASRNGFAIRIAKVHGNHTHITTEKSEQADHLANHVGELYGRLAVHRYTAEETPAEKSLYRRSPMADGLKKKATIATQRNIAEAVAFMERGKPNTYDTTVQTVMDKVEADKAKTAAQHPDEDAGQWQAELR